MIRGQTVAPTSIIDKRQIVAIEISSHLSFEIYKIGQFLLELQHFLSETKNLICGRTVAPTAIVDKRKHSYFFVLIILVSKKSKIGQYSTKIRLIF